MQIVIPLPPRTKKNSQQIVTINGRPIIIQSKEYKAYEKACGAFMPRLKKPIDEPVNVRCVYYMPTRRRVDLTNLLGATADILTHYGVLADDNRNVMYAVDGSRVFYDKDKPRVEITIDPINEEVERWSK